MNSYKWRLPVILSGLVIISLSHAGQRSLNKDLRLAIDRKDYPAIEMLLDAGADVNKQSSSGLSLLYKAVRGGDEKLVALLVKKGAELEITDEQGRTPLYMARDAAVAKILIHAGAVRNGIDDNGDTPLHYAARKMICHDVVVLLLESSLVLVNALNNNDWSPLHYAAHHGCNENVQTLLDHHADTSLRTNLGKTPLRLAVESDRVKTVKILLRSKADVNTVDNEGRTSLHWAVENERIEMAEILLSEGVRWGLKDNNGKTALMIAEEKKLDAFVKIINEFIVQAFLDRGINWEPTRDPSMFTALRLAIEQNHIARAKALLQFCEDVNALDSRGESSLHSAASTGKDAIVKKLIEYRAHLDLKVPSSGQTALMLAVKGEHLTVVEDLINAGADVHAMRNDGMTVLEIANEEGNQEILTILLRAHSKNIRDKLLGKIGFTVGKFLGCIKAGGEFAGKLISHIHIPAITAGVVGFMGLAAVVYRVDDYKRHPIAFDPSVSMASQYEQYQRNLGGPQ